LTIKPKIEMMQNPISLDEASEVSFFCRQTKNTKKFFGDIR
jgi:hypothetical protein